MISLLLGTTKLLVFLFLYLLSCVYNQINDSMNCGLLENGITLLLVSVGYFAIFGSAQREEHCISGVLGLLDSILV